MAAFYRIDSKNTHVQTLVGIEGYENNYINMPGIPLHHHQGLYKTGNTYYITGNTRREIPCYSSVLGENNNLIKLTKKINQSKILLFDKDIINNYRHAGGLQVSGNLLVAGGL